MKAKMNFAPVKQSEDMKTRLTVYEFVPTSEPMTIEERAELFIKSMQDLASEIQRPIAIEIVKVECEDIIAELKTFHDAEYKISIYKQMINYLESQ